MGAPAIKGGGLAGDYTKEEGIFAYFEICEKIKVNTWKKSWDEKQQSVYASHDDQWVGYDNLRSIALKVKWALTMSLGGTMLWTLDFDDYLGGFCDEGAFPLANAIKSVFDEYTTPSSQLMSSNTTVPSEASEDNLTLHEYDTEYISTTKSNERQSSNYTTKQTTLFNAVNMNYEMLEAIDQKKIHGITHEILNAPYTALSNSLKSNHTHNLSSVQLRARTNSVNKLRNFLSFHFFYLFISIICKFL